MAEREKVIRGLELCAYDPDPGQELKELRSCPECPYYRAGCTPQLIRDALSLLKGQEPRVMTLEEARATLRTADFLYCEDKNDDTMAGGLMRGVLNGSDYWDLINGEYMTPDCLDEGEDLEAEYGKTFRFWTSRPTPEQMRDTKWEADNETL